MKNIHRFFRRGVCLAVLPALALLLVSCGQGSQNLKEYDISEIYGYTFYGNITASSGTTLKPSLILYNDERADWNMSVSKESKMNAVSFYYYAEKKGVNRYTLYWFGGGDSAAAMNHDKSKAAMTVQLGINSLNEVVVLLTGDKLTEIGAMQNTRVPMTKQTGIPRNTDAPTIAFDPNIKDEPAIEVPSGASANNWGGNASYTGTFDYLVGLGGNVTRGHGTCGIKSDGTPITPEIGITPDGTHTVKLTMHRFAYDSNMTIEPYTVSGVQVFKNGSEYYLKYDAPTPDHGVPATKADGTTIRLKKLSVRGILKDGKLELRVSFLPGVMPLPIIERFRSN